MKYLILILTLIPSLALAQELDPSFVPPSWLQSLILIVKSLPYLGPVLVEVFKWAGVLASALTALSAFLMALKKSLELAAQFSWLSWFDKVAGWIGKALPYVQYLSMFNAQPKKEEKK